jgi:hypothetical protein
MIVQVYYNLHKHVWSIRCKKTMKVIAHLDKITLRDCKFKVQQGGRKRVIAEQRKNVHAYIEGVWDALEGDLDSLNDYVSYNPYLGDSFYDVKTKENLYNAKICVMENKKVSYLK